MNRAPRVVIPPTQKCRKSTVCRSEQRVRRRRAPTLRKPFFCRNKPRAGLFRHRQSGQRVVIPPPHGNAENAKRELLSPPPTGLPPKPREAVSVGRRRCSGVSEFSSAAATETSDMQLVPPTASIAFVWSAAKPLPCQMRRAGHGPTPHFRAETRTHLKPPSSPRGREKSFQKGH